MTCAMPLQIYLARESDADLALTPGMVLLGVTAFVIAPTETSWEHLATLIRSVRSGRTFASEVIGAPYVDVPADIATASRESDAGADIRVTGTITERGWGANAPLRPGLVTTIVDRNDAGKSIFAQVIARAPRLDKGSARISERAVDDAEMFVPVRRRSVAMISQVPRIFAHADVLVNVAFPLRVRGVGHAQARVTAADQLRAVSIADLVHRRASNPSGG